jgi:hypothetical protein
MNKRLSLFLVLVFVCEVVVYFWSSHVSDLVEIKYSLAARYSARITLILFEGMLIWMAIAGLKIIFGDEKRRAVFVTILFLIAFNHVIHFVFLAINFWVNDYNLFVLKSAGGAIGYLIIIGAPFYLWHKMELTKNLYWVILSLILFINIVAMVTYLGRWNKGLPMASSKEVYIGIMVGIGVILLLNVYRIVSELKVGVKSIKND